MKLSKAIKEKRPELTNRKGIMSHHDNARSHIFSNTYEIIGAWLGSDVASPIHPDLTPSDYHLFRNLQNFLNGKNFSNNDDLNLHLAEFFAVKDQKFSRRGIMKLPERWQKVIEQNGKYLTD